MEVVRERSQEESRGKNNAPESREELSGDLCGRMGGRGGRISESTWGKIASGPVEVLLKQTL